MAIYNTVQRQELIRFLKKHSEKPMTIAEIYSVLSADEDFTDIPAQSSIYRLIRDMTDEGIVSRNVKGNSRQFVYQYVGDGECRNHLHMKCTKCGQVYHLSEETSRIIVQNVLENDSFSLENDTVLSGKCANCK